MAKLILHIYLETKLNPFRNLTNRGADESRYSLSNRDVNEWLLALGEEGSAGEGGCGRGSRGVKGLEGMMGDCG